MGGSQSCGAPLGYFAVASCLGMLVAAFGSTWHHTTLVGALKVKLETRLMGLLACEVTFNYVHSFGRQDAIEHVRF